LYNYKINKLSKHECRVISGKIIPALLTTTATISGLLSLEFYKLILGKDVSNHRDMLSWQVDLGISSYTNNIFTLSK
jgi:hypothetical protein